MLRAFVSYPFCEQTRSFADSIQTFLGQMDVDSVDGKWPDATIPLPENIIAKIKDCDVLISLTFELCPSRWADQEIGLAIGLGLDVIQITDGDVPRCGLIAEQYRICRSNGDFFVCTALAHSVRCIKQRRSADVGPALSSNAPLDEIDSEAWPTEVRNLIFRLRALFSESQFEQIVKEATAASETYPDCWRFRVAQSAALTHLNKYDEADKLLDDVISQFKNQPRALSYAYDNKAWVMSRRKSGTVARSLKSRLNFHRRALKAEERVVAYINVVACLLQLDEIEEAERELANCLARFPRALEAFRSQVTTQGREFVQAVTKSHLLSALLFPRH